MYDDLLAVKKMLSDFKDIGELMSNFDHIVDKNVAEKLKKTPNIMAGYPGWNFYAYCWFKEGKYHALVLTYQQPREVFSEDTPEELMQEICMEYGSD